MNDTPVDEQEYRDAITEDHRPWGKFRRYPHERAAGIKIITVSPGGTLSLQYHRRRSEFWVVLDPGLEVTVGQKTWRPAVGDEVFVPREAVHRLRGVGDRPARVMEIWLGPSEESDIVRVEDVYGRR
ncbi:MAG: phosphomannose isomerase type II C-terminal cupin domain [Candidatus Aminicenantes bacterium]|nr:phosphomannose isomerase type II C-terminal cupin domain [Candidatus Aminicenantes bacterium]